MDIIMVIQNKIKQPDFAKEIDSLAKRIKGKGV
jgi:hypothetical protein